MTYTAGTGISIDASDVISNTGVLSVLGSTNIGVSTASGAVTLSVQGTVPSAGISSNLFGGNVGSLPFQTSSSTTAMLPPGNEGEVLTIQNGIPSWTTSALANLKAGNGISISNGIVSNTGIVNVVGTPQQISAINIDGVISLSLPQPLSQSSSPTFISVTLGTTPISSYMKNGSLAVGGSKNGYCGFEFTSSYGSRSLLISTSNTPTSGLFNTAQNSWDWQFTGGTLTVGTVPAQNIGKGTAPISITGNAGSADFATTAQTRNIGDNSDFIATTAFVQSQIAATGSAALSYWSYGNTAAQQVSGVVNFQTPFANTPINISAYQNGVITIKFAGIYFITASITISANAEANFIGSGSLFLQHNNSLITGGSNSWVSSDIYNNVLQNNTVTVSGLVHCNSGDTISVFYSNSSGQSFISPSTGQFIGFKVA
jgi:hypothetical protein